MTIEPRRRESNYRAHLVHPPFHILSYSSGVASTNGEVAVHILCTLIFVAGRDSLFGTLLAEVHSGRKSPKSLKFFLCIDNAIKVIREILNGQIWVRRGRGAGVARA